MPDLSREFFNRKGLKNVENGGCCRRYGHTDPWILKDLYLQRIRTDAKS